MNEHVSKTRPARDLVLRVRCTGAERAEWLRKASAEERSMSDYARCVLSAEPMRRRACPPEVDPILLAAVGRAGNNLNQIARAMNFDLRKGCAIDLIAVRTLLVALDRKLTEIIVEHSR